MYRNFIKKIDKKIIAVALSAYFGSEKFTFKKLEGGFENASFFVETNGKKYVLRIYNAIQYGVHIRDEGNILTELDFVEFLRKKNIPVPKIHKTLSKSLFTKVMIDKNEHFAILTDFIEGSQVKKLSFKQIENIAKIQAKINHYALLYKPEKIRRVAGPLGVQKWIRSELKKYIPPHNRVGLIKEATEIIDFLDTKINPKTIKKYPAVLIHGDLHCQNLKFVGNRISGVFDFDDIKKSIRADDIGSFLMEILKNGSEEEIKKRAEVYFDQYKKINPITPDEVSLSIYFAARRRLIFKMLEFMGIWEAGKMDSIRDFKTALSQVRKIIALADEHNFI